MQRKKLLFESQKREETLVDVLPQNYGQYFLRLENLIKKIPDLKKRNELVKSLKAKNLDSIIAAYFELSIFDILDKADLNPKFLDPRPDLEIKLIDGSLVSIECSILNLFGKKEWKHQQQAMNLLSNLHGSSEISQNNEDNGFIITILHYNGKNLSSERSDIINYFKGIRNEKYKSENIEFSCANDPLNKRNFISFQFSNSIKASSFEKKLNEKKLRTDINHPYIISLYFWDHRILYTVDEDGNYVVDITIENFHHILKKYFSQSPNVSGLLLFPCGFLPISGTYYSNGKEFPSPTQLRRKKGAWTMMEPWSEEGRIFIFIKNLNSTSQQIPDCFRNCLSQVIKMHYEELG